ncbi:MAG: hypothetical protein E7236_02950 [Lachnospiraceae bacterium]|nr:hypothetical protein [Lachnospiraceae bacterium]
MKLPIAIITEYLAEWNPVSHFITSDDQLMFDTVSIVYSEQTLFLNHSLYVIRSEEELANMTSGTAVFPGKLSSYPKTVNIIEIDYPDSPEKLCSEINQCIHSYSNWAEQLNLSIISGCTLQTLVDQSEPFLKNPFVIFNGTFDCVAASNNITEDDPLYYDVKKHGKPSPETMLQLSEHNKNRKVENGMFYSGKKYRLSKGIADHYEIFVDFAADGSLSYGLNLRFKYHPISPGLLAVIGIFTEKLAQYIDLNHTKDENTGIISFNEYLFPRVLDKDPDAIKLAVNFPPFSRDYIIITSNSSSFRGISNNILSVTPGSSLFCHEKRYYIFIPTELSDEKSFYFIHQQEKRIAEVSSAYQIYIGISGPVIGYAGLESACVQAVHALELSDKAYSHTSDNEYLLLYRDIALFDMAVHYSEHHQAKSFAPLGYLRMKEHDKKKGTDYCAFIKTYIMNGCNAAATAQKLFLHKNSIIYRVDKIKERFGLNISSTYEQLLFLMACITDEAIKE